MKDVGTIRLAVAGGANALGTGLSKQSKMEKKPALLVSYVYLGPFQKNRHKFDFRDWAMDSGAFSAHNSGKVIDLSAYIDKCHELKATDPQLVEIFSLDVIGDWKASITNARKMRDAGIDCIPTFHPGEPWSALTDMAKEFPKISIGGVVRWPRKKKKHFIGQCFARVWPTKVHGLGMVDEDLLLSFPFHSVDASNWEQLPTAFGQWKTFGKMSVRGNHNLRAEVEHYLELERRFQFRWRNEWQKANVLRLAAVSGRSVGKVDK